MRRWHQRPLARVASIAALIAALCWLIYIVVANALLATGYIESRVSKADERLLEIDRAWTFWPGRVHIQGFRVAYAEEDLELEIGFERGVVVLDLAALMRRELHVHRLDADAMRFRLRRLLDEPERHPERVRALPRIEGFSADARARPDEPDASGASERRKLWTFEITGIDAGVSELWVDEFKYAGSGRIRGAFRFEPDRALEVRDSEVVLGAGTLGFGELRPIADRIEGAIRGHVERLDVSDDARLGWRAFRNFTLRGTLSTELAGLGFANAYMSDRKFSLGGGAGSFELLLAVERGVFQPESYAEYRSQSLALGSDALALRGDVRLRVDTTEQNGRARGRVRLGGERIDVVAERKLVVGSARDVDFELINNSVDLGRKWRARAGRASIGSVGVPDLERLNRFKNGGDWRLSGGALDASADASLLPNGSVSGKLALRLRSATARVGDVRVHASGSARTRVVQSNLRSQNGQLREASLDLAHFSFATRTGQSGPGKLRARSSRIGYRAFAPTDFEVQFSSAFNSAEGVLDALDVARTGVSRFARAFVDLDDLRVRGSVRYAGGKLSVDIDRATTDGVEASGEVEPGENSRGRFEVDLGLFELSKRFGR